jgi:DNA polymerase III sliding clamp (beta) subunit (PCNA family)
MKKQLVNAAKISAKQKSITECEYVRIDSTFITATNLDTFYKFKHDIPSVEGVGTVQIVNLKKAYDKLKGIDLIKFEDDKCHIIKGKVKLSFHSIRDGEWVTLPLSPSKKIGVVNLDANFDKAKKFVGNDIYREVMHCVLYNETQVVATNAHYLYFKNHGFDITEDFLVIKDVFFANGEYTVYKEGDWILLEGTEEAITYKVDASLKYPNYKGVIPIDNSNVSRFNIAELKSNIDTLMLTANSVTNRIDVYPDKMTSKDIGFDSMGCIEINQDIVMGDAMDISFNGKLMMYCLNALDVNDVEISTSTKDRAMILNGHILLMPVGRY